MKNIYIGALDIIESKIEAVGIMMSRTSDDWSIHSLQDRMSHLHELKRSVIQRSGINKNVIYVDFQLKRKVS